MARNIQHGLGKESGAPRDKATILSVNEGFVPNTVRVSVQWDGDHDISDFDLQRFGKVLQIQGETNNTAWAIIERPFRAAIAHTIPGWAINESMRQLIAGDTIPLRPNLK